MPKQLPASSASAQSTNHTTTTMLGKASMSPPPSPLLSCPEFSSTASKHSYCTRSKSCDYKDVLINLQKEIRVVNKGESVA